MISNSKSDVVDEGGRDGDLCVLSFPPERLVYSRSLLFLLAEAGREALVRYLRKKGMKEGVIKLLDNVIYLHMTCQRVDRESGVFDVSMAAEAVPEVSRLLDEFEAEFPGIVIY